MKNKALVYLILSLSLVATLQGCFFSGPKIDSFTIKIIPRPAPIWNNPARTTTNCKFAACFDSVEWQKLQNEAATFVEESQYMRSLYAEQTGTPLK